MWNERYSIPDYVYGREPNDFLAAEMGKIPMGRVLEIGAGEGRNSVFLALQGYEVTSVDQSSVGLEKARKLAEEKGVEIETIEANLHDFEIEPEAWQGIVATFVHLTVDLRRRVLKKCVHGLANGGVLILEAFTPSQLKYDTGGPKDPMQLYTLADLRNDLVGLTIEYGEELERDVSEGKRHTGKAAVVQVVARKV